MSHFSNGISVDCHSREPDEVTTPLWKGHPRFSHMDCGQFPPMHMHTDRCLCVPPTYAGWKHILNTSEAHSVFQNLREGTHTPLWLEWSPPFKLCHWSDGSPGVGLSAAKAPCCHLNLPAASATTHNRPFQLLQELSGFQKSRCH